MSEAYEVGTAFDATTRVRAILRRRGCGPWGHGPWPTARVHVKPGVLVRRKAPFEVLLLGASVGTDALLLGWPTSSPDHEWRPEWLPAHVVTRIEVL